MRSLTAAADGESWLHRRDARAKLAGLVAVSLGVTAAGPRGVAVGALAATAVGGVARLPLRTLAWQLRAVLPIVVLGTLARAATVDAGLWSVDGLLAGVLASARFVLLIAFAVAVAGTTTPREVAAAVEWLLRPVPGVAAADWATMFGAAVRFLPLIDEEVAAVRDAHRSRLGGERGVLDRLVRVLVGTVAGTLRRADALALAMRGRAYAVTRTPRAVPAFGVADAALTAGGAAVAVAVAVL